MYHFLLVQIKMEKYKKIQALILLLCFAAQLFFSNINIRAEELSVTVNEWAKAEVDLALANGIVPISLQTNYQQDIKRYEYVLLALKILDLENSQTRIIRQFPFGDIFGHPYEDEIVLAYNAGIIKGDGNGKFRPDDYISRQEIAVLISNLITSVQKVNVLQNVKNYTFFDTKEISSWSRDSINYCYSKEIILGIGSKSNVPIISPLIKTTREQAVLMMLRVGNTLKAFDETVYSDVIVIDKNTGTTTVSNGLVEVAKGMGDEIAQLIQEIILDTNAKIYVLEKNLVELQFNDSHLKIKIDSSGNDILYSTNNLDDEKDKEYLKRLGNITYKEVIDTPLNRSYLELPLLNNSTMTLGITDYATLILSTTGAINYKYHINIIEKF